MALWGNRDSFAITGTANTTNGSAIVTGTGTTFSTQVDIGDSLYINSVHVKVDSITSNTVLVMT